MGEFLLFEKELPSLISNGEKPKVEKKIEWATEKKSKINIIVKINIKNLYW